MRTNLSEIKNWFLLNEESFVKYMLDNSIEQVVNDYTDTYLIYDIDNIRILINVFSKNILINNIIY